MENQSIAERLVKHARQLASEGGNLYRSRAYRTAAQAVLALDRPVKEILEQEGTRCLRSVRGIGPHISWTISHLVRTGEFIPYSERKTRELPPSKTHAVPA
jgi:DNA polymerase/3'-5' exonuclease PolX